MLWAKLYLWNVQWVNTKRPEQNGYHFTDEIFKYIFLIKICYILIQIAPELSKQMIS